jgi:proline racemase
MTEPVTEITLEAPGGLVAVRADCRDGKAQRIRVCNPPSFADRLGVPLDVPGLGRLSVDAACGADGFVGVDAVALGFSHSPEDAHAMAELGVQITGAAGEQPGSSHPETPDWRHFSVCLFAGPLTRTADAWGTKHAVSIRPGKVLRARSLIGGQFEGRIAGAARVGDLNAILPEISGRAWITGTHRYMLDPADPWPEGCRLSDTWGAR